MNVKSFDRIVEDWCQPSVLFVDISNKMKVDFITVKNYCVHRNVFQNCLACVFLRIEFASLNDRKVQELTVYTQNAVVIPILKLLLSHTFSRDLRGRQTPFPYFAIFEVCLNGLTHITINFLEKEPTGLNCSDFGMGVE